MNKTDFYIWLIRKILGGKGGEYLIRSLGFSMIRSLFYFAMRQNEDKNSLVYYEFGVGWRTLNPYVNALESYCKDYDKNLEDNQIVLFDSFEGLPASDNIKDSHELWPKGAFSIGINEVKRGLKFNPDKVMYVKGFYESSLTNELRLILEQPDIITIDVDYYSSTKRVLEWLRPLLKNGAIFFFDDLWAFYGAANMGELAAIKEFNEKGDGLILPYPLISPTNCYVYSNYQGDKT